MSSFLKHCVQLCSVNSSSHFALTRSVFLPAQVVISPCICDYINWIVVVSFYFVLNAHKFFSPRPSSSYYPGESLRYLLLLAQWEIFDNFTTSSLDAEYLCLVFSSVMGSLFDKNIFCFLKFSWRFWAVILWNMSMDVNLDDLIYFMVRFYDELWDLSWLTWANNVFGYLFFAIIILTWCWGLTVPNLSYFDTIWCRAARREFDHFSPFTI